MYVGERIEFVAVSSIVTHLIGPAGRLSERKMRGICTISMPSSTKPGSAARVSIKVIRLACSLRYDSRTGRYPLSWHGAKKTCLHCAMRMYSLKCSRSLWSALSFPPPTSMKLNRGCARPNERPKARSSLSDMMIPHDWSFAARPGKLSST